MEFQRFSPMADPRAAILPRVQIDPKIGPSFSKLCTRVRTRSIFCEPSLAMNGKGVVVRRALKQFKQNILRSSVCGADICCLFYL